jgi:hypothetical protein
MRTPGIRGKLFTALAGALLIAGCSSTLGDILGGGRGDPYPTEDIGEVRATVDQIDTRNRIIYVQDAETYRRDLRNAGREDLAIYYDERTLVEYDGREYRPQDLEPGDRIVAQVDVSGGNRVFAERIEVVYDVSSSGGSQSDVYGDLRGFVRNVDTRDRELELENVRWNRRFDSGDYGDRGVVVVEYDTSTVVEFQGQQYRPENLERGDEVEVQVRDLGQRLMAEEIVVVRDARAGL